MYFAYLVCFWGVVYGCQMCRLLITTVTELTVVAEHEDSTLLITGHVTWHITGEVITFSPHPIFRRFIWSSFLLPVVLNGQCWRNLCTKFMCSLPPYPSYMPSLLLCSIFNLHFTSHSWTFSTGEGLKRTLNGCCLFACNHLNFWMCRALALSILDLFKVYSPRRVGFTMPNEPLWPLLELHFTSYFQDSL